MHKSLAKGMVLLLLAESPLEVSIDDDSYDGIGDGLVAMYLPSDGEEGVREVGCSVVAFRDLISLV